MKEKTACFDIDRTLTRDLVFVPLIKSENQTGLLSDGSFHSIIGVLGRYKRGELAYEDAVEQACVLHAGGLKGQRYEDVKSHAADLFRTREEELFRAFVRPTFDLLRDSHRLIVVTSEPQYVAEATKEQFGLDAVISSVYSVSGGLFTGTLQRSLAHRSQKAAALEDVKIDYAFGDSEGDIDMLMAARKPVCVDPTPGLRQLAIERGWLIVDAKRDTIADIIGK